ncbi:MAG: recombinase family protein, partial [Opitutaceae bacterium]
MASSNIETQLNHGLHTGPAAQHNEHDRTVLHHWLQFHRNTVHWQNKKLTVNPQEAPIVKQVFELFVQLRRKGTVARRLNEAGHRTREGAAWRDSQVSRILFEPASKGVYFYNTRRRIGDWQYEDKPEHEWSKLAVPPVVTEDLWHQASIVLAEQEGKGAKPSKTPVRLFGGLTVCGCGHRMCVPSGSRKYTCTKCKNKILDEDLEAIFYDEVKEYFARPERVAQKFAEARKRVDDKEERLAHHRQEIQKVRDEMNRTHRLYLADQISLERFGGYHRPLEERLKQLQEGVARLEGELDHIKVGEVSADQVLHEARGLYARWPKMPIEEKRRIVQSLVESITIGNGEIDIRFSHLP